MRSAVECVANIYTPGVGWSYKNLTLSLTEEYELRIEDEDGNVVEFDTSAIDELHEEAELYDEDTVDGELEWNVE